MTTALVRKSPLGLLAGPWDGLPGRIETDGVRVDSPGVGWTDGYRLLVDVAFSGNQPTEYHTLASQNYGLSGNTLTVTRTWQAPTPAAVKIILKAKLNADATQQWFVGRGAKAAQIEQANLNGSTAIDAAATIVAAISAYQAVVWP